MEIFDGLLEQFNLVMFLSGIGAMFLSLIGALFLSKQIIKPIKDISNTLTRINKFGLEETSAYTTTQKMKFLNWRLILMN